MKRNVVDLRDIAGEDWRRKDFENELIRTSILTPNGQNQINRNSTERFF
jgi:hypothetical protein